MWKNTDWPGEIQKLSGLSEEVGVLLAFWAPKKVSM
jgi:hypothetical protein